MAEGSRAERRKGMHGKPPFRPTASAIARGRTLDPEKHAKAKADIKAAKAKGGK